MNQSSIEGSQHERSASPYQHAALGLKQLKSRLLELRSREDDPPTKEDF